MHSRPILRIALLLGFASALAGCQGLKEAAGGGKESPDEFAVVTKALLVIPPDFNLKPPAPGTAPTNQIEPTQAAQNALFNADPATVAATLPATMSPGERYLLGAAGVQNSDPTIRQQIASDTSGMRGADDSFTNDVLFWQAPSSGGTPVDADAEAHNLDAAHAGGTPSSAPNGTRPPAPPPADNDDDDWLDHLWPF